MNVPIDKEVTLLRRLSIRQLRTKFAEAFGEEARPTNNRVWLVKRIAWRIQALAEGDLSTRALKRAGELANDADLRLSAPRPAKTRPAVAPRGQTTMPQSSKGDALPRPGTILTRPYKGATVQVAVLPLGFGFEGKIFPSLSAVAKAITGSHCSGRRFFRLTQKGRRP